jgi:hypothetical protein
MEIFLMGAWGFTAFIFFIHTRINKDFSMQAQKDRDEKNKVSKELNELRYQHYNIIDRYKSLMYTKLNRLAKETKKQELYDEIKIEIGHDITRILASNDNYQMPFSITANLSHYLNNPMTQSDLLMKEIDKCEGVHTPSPLAIHGSFMHPIADPDTELIKY